MEPMTLGSPGSPSPSGGGSGLTGTGGGTNNFLPLYLMGDNSQPTTPRSNTLSPTRGRTQLAFGSTPRGSGGGGASSPADFNRSLSVLQQRSLFGGGVQQQQQQHQSQQHQQHQQAHHHSHQQLNASLSGPPTMGLFDSLKATGTAANSTSTSRGPIAHNPMLSSSAANFSVLSNSSYAFNDSCLTAAGGGGSDPYLSPTTGPGDFNVSRLTSPVAARQQPHEFRTPYGDAAAATSPLSPRQATAPFWVTVFGFPPAAVSAILAHFAQCGSIVDKVLPPNGGNWMHLRYASRVDCDKAVNFNERVIGNSMMIGVVYCRDAEIVDKENGGGGAEQMQREQRNSGGVPVNRVRPLAQSAYHNSLSPTEVVLSPPMPKRSTGLVNKAMDMIFGW